jgi:Sulfotransferase domain
MKQPSFFIVGAPKCGTTALCKYLNRHPDIFVPPLKELNFFDLDIKSNKKANNLQEYLNFFAEGEGKVCGEGSPTYLRSEKAAQEIYNFNPDAKIIIMLREPVSLLYSLHSQNLYNGSSEDIKDFKQALEAESDRKSGKRIPKICVNPQDLYYRDVVKFTEQIERYFNFFGKEKVKIILFDDFQKDTNGVYQEILVFLGVNPVFETAFQKINSNKQVRNTTLQQIIKRPPSKLLEIGKYFIPLSRKQRRALLEGMKERLKRLNTQRTSRPPLDGEFRQQLQQELAPEIKRLSQLIDRDLSHWY